MFHFLGNQTEALSFNCVKNLKLKILVFFFFFGWSWKGPEASEMPSNSAPPRNSSKRSRAAEIHNLSEKVGYLMLEITLFFTFYVLILELWLCR